MNKRIIFAGAAAVFLAVVGVVVLRAAPSVGLPAANPAYVVINTPTTVLITSRITDASLITTSVNLLSVDASGKTLAILGTMRDDGTNGDAVSGDRTYSFRVTVSEPAVGQKYYRVSAAFKGVLQRTISQPVVVTIDPFALPPDPGEAGKQTLEGIDSDHDGVRDDVQRYIALQYQSDAAVRAALTQLFRANQTFITTADATPASLRDVALRRGLAQDCLTYTVGDEARSFAIQRVLKAVFLNTKQRSLAFVARDSALSGQFFPLGDPAHYRDGCEFDPAHPGH